MPLWENALLATSTLREFCRQTQVNAANTRTQGLADDSNPVLARRNTPPSVQAADPDAVQCLAVERPVTYATTETPVLCHWGMLQP
jgi:hypothetical protein